VIAGWLILDDFYQVEARLLIWSKILEGIDIVYTPLTISRKAPLSNLNLQVFSILRFADMTITFWNLFILFQRLIVWRKCMIRLDNFRYGAPIQ
jgi:hypothetical protein